MRHSFGGLLVVALLVSANTVSVNAQVPEEKKSVIAFDVQLNKIREGALYKKMNGDEMIADMQKQSRMDEVDFNKIDRFIGSLGYPSSVMDFANADQLGVVPIEFFVRALFSDQAAAAALYEDFEGKSKITKADGRDYLRPKGDNEPANISICKLNEKTVEMGTDGYVMEETRNFRTARLTEAWTKLPAYPIRFSADAETAEALIEEALQMAGGQMPPQAAVMMTAVKDVSTISVAIDVESNPMIAIRLTGKTEAGASTLAATLNGLLAMAKGFGQQSVGQLPSADMRKSATEILAALEAKQNGTEITLNIPRPEGFENAVSEGVVAARAAAKAAQGKNNMKQIGLAMHNYHSAYRKLPFKAVHESQSDDLSWRVRVLPFIEQFQMFEQMDMAKGHDEAPNKQFAADMPVVFEPNEKTIVCTIGETLPERFRDITDGLSNTIAFIEVPADTVENWMEPGSITIDDAVKTITNAPAGKTTVCMYDGAVFDLDKSTDADLLRAMMTFNGGEVVNR